MEDIFQNEKKNNRIETTTTTFFCPFLNLFLFGLIKHIEREKRKCETFQFDGRNWTKRTVGKKSRKSVWDKINIEIDTRLIENMSKVYTLIGVIELTGPIKYHFCFLHFYLF